VKVKKRHLQSFLSEWVLPNPEEEIPASKEALQAVANLWQLFSASDWKTLRGRMNEIAREKTDQINLRIRAGFAEPWMEEAHSIINGKELV